MKATVIIRLELEVPCKCSLAELAKEGPDILEFLGEAIPLEAEGSKVERATFLVTPA